MNVLVGVGCRSWTLAWVIPIRVVDSPVDSQRKRVTASYTRSEGMDGLSEGGCGLSVDP